MTNPEVLPRKVYTNPTTRFVRSLEGDYLMLSEVAVICDVSPFTLRKFIADDVKKGLPSSIAMFGKTLIYLYTQEDVQRIQELLKERNQVSAYNGPLSRKSGRPTMYSNDEKTNLKRLYSRHWYYKERVREFTEAGNMDKAAAAQSKADKIQQEINEARKS